MGYRHRPGAAEEGQLERLGLGAAGNKKVKHYSLGMRQRLGLARAVLTHPELLVLDEPANALDAAGMKQVRDLLRTLCRDWGTTVFLSSHLLSEVEQIADTVGILHRGRLLREISLSELAAQSLTYIELVTPDVRAAARVLEELGCAGPKCCRRVWCAFTRRLWRRKNCPVRWPFKMWPLPRFRNMPTPWRIIICA